MKELKSSKEIFDKAMNQIFFMGCVLVGLHIALLMIDIGIVFVWFKYRLH